MRGSEIKHCKDEVRDNECLREYLYVYILQ